MSDKAATGATGATFDLLEGQAAIVLEAGGGLQLIQPNHDDDAAMGEHEVLAAAIAIKLTDKAWVAEMLAEFKLLTADYGEVN